VTSVVARGSAVYAKVSHRRSMTTCSLKSGAITRVRRCPDGQYKICFSPSSNPPLAIVASVDGEDAERTCLGLVTVGDVDDEEVRYELGEIPRFNLTVSVGKARRKKYDHVLVSAWRQPTVKTLEAALSREARPKRGKCDFIVQIIW